MECFSTSNAVKLMSSLTSSAIIFTVEGKSSQIIRGGIVGVFFFPFMLVINEKYATSDSCLLAAVKNHSAMSVHKLTVHTLDRKQVRFRRTQAAFSFNVLGKIMLWFVFTAKCS